MASHAFAGNVLLLDDGRIGLIDWGQVSRLPLQQRVLFAKGVLAVAARDEPLIAELAWEMGMLDCCLGNPFAASLESFQQPVENKP